LHARLSIVPLYLSSNNEEQIMFDNFHDWHCYINSQEFALDLGLNSIVVNLSPYGGSLVIKLIFPLMYHLIRFIVLGTFLNRVHLSFFQNEFLWKWRRCLEIFWFNLTKCKRKNRTSSLDIPRTSSLDIPRTSSLDIPRTSSFRYSKD